jgi:hypothetical protein
MSDAIPYVHGHAGDFGFTDDESMWLAVQHWRDAALADGWSIAPTYGDHEPVESAARLTRPGGWVVQVLSRDRRETGRGKAFEATIHAWGPDGLAVTPPPIYDFAAMQSGLRTCLACGATDVATQRVNFAGRVCITCLPEQRRLTERPGWTS